MIYNERQYKITSKQIENMNSALDETFPNDTPDWIQEAQLDALKSQISDLEAQLTEYALIKSGHIDYSECSELKDLPKALIQSRIAKGLSQKELATKLGMTAQQIQRYESTRYMGASLSRLIEISDILGVSVKETWHGASAAGGDSIFVWNNETNIEWNKFPFKEMIGRGWVKIENKASPEDSVKDYFINSAGTQYATAFHRKKFHGKNTPNEYSLLAWQTRVIEKAHREFSDGMISEFELNDSWVNELTKLSTQPSAPFLVKEYLARKGIILIAEEHLSKTYLDGAAMLLDTGNPVIALTLRHDRLDNFWFVLMHELGHVFLHLFESLNFDYFDEENGNSEDEIEIEADNFALNLLIPEESWSKCLSRFSMTENSVQLDANNLGIHPSIIAGRIRKERNNYRILNSLIGQGEVRRVLKD